MVEKRSQNAFEVDNYLEHVLEIANALGKIFVLDTGEGNAFQHAITGWDIEDLSGWLIEPYMKARFLAEREKGTHYQSFADYYVLAKWTLVENEDIRIDFVPFKSFSL